MTRGSCIARAVQFVLMDVKLQAILACLVIGITFVGVLYAIPHGQKIEDDLQLNYNYNRSVCQSDECQRIAQRFRSAMNTAVDPCDDFYDYVCGNWTIQPDLPDGEIQRSYLTILAEKVRRDLKEIVEEKPNIWDDELLTKLKRFYRQCMDLNERDKVGVDPLINHMNVIGGWPMTMEKGTSKNYTWQEVDNYYVKLDGQSVFFDITYVSHYEGVHTFIPYLKPKTAVPLVISMVKYENSADPRNPHVKTIVALASVIAEALKANVTYEDMRKEAIEVYEFQKSLSRAFSPLRLKAKDITYSFSTMKDLEDMNIGKDKSNDVTSDPSESESSENNHTKIDFRAVFTRLFERVGVDISDQEQILLKNVASFAKLAELVKQTPNRVIVNYIHYNFMIRMMKYGPQKMRDIEKETYNYNNLQFLAKKPQWEQCLTQLNMGDAMSYYYVNKYFQEESLYLVNDMVENIKSATVGRIMNSGWLDYQGKKTLENKLFHLEKLLGYPYYLKNLTYLTILYEDVLIKSNYIDTALSLITYNVKEKVLYTQRPYDRRDWQQYKAYDANAFYLRNGNSIIIPAGLLQEPYFNLRAPIAVTYGSLGTILGHELTHSFDTLGKGFNWEGRIGVWLNARTTSAYDKRANCFIEQFNNYSLFSPIYPNTPVKLDGTRVQNENIADSAGIKTTYDAFRAKLRQGDVVSESLPGFEGYTDDQMFFLSFAHSWCDALLPEYVVSVAQYDKHSPSRLRVRGTLANSYEFAEAFRCPAGRTMTPERKCGLW